MDLTWLGWRTQANTFFFSWDPIAWRDMLEEDLVLDPHMRKDQWRPGQVQWWWSTCPLLMALGWYRQPPHICHPATKIYSPCFYRSSVGASHLTRWKPVQGGKRHFGLLLAIQVNLDKGPVTWKTGVWLLWRGSLLMGANQSPEPAWICPLESGPLQPGDSVTLKYVTRCPTGHLNIWRNFFQGVKGKEGKTPFPFSVLFIRPQSSLQNTLIIQTLVQLINNDVVQFSPEWLCLCNFD